MRWHDDALPVFARSAGGIEMNATFTARLAAPIRVAFWLGPPTVPCATAAGTRLVGTRHVGIIKPKRADRKCLPASMTDASGVQNSAQVPCCDLPVYGENLHLFADRQLRQALRFSVTTNDLTAFPTTEEFIDAL
jgi:hypothetical protein